MKRNYSFSKSMISITLMAVFSLTFVSCYEDDPYYDDWYDNYNWYGNAYDYTNWDGDNSNELSAEAAALCHPWSGTLVYRYYENGVLQAAQMDVDLLFDRYDSNSVNGRGQETDYANNESQVLKFSWYIDPKTESIYIKYDTSSEIFCFDATQTGDNGFTLNSNNFTGYAGGTNVSKSIYVTLTRASLAKTALSSKAKTTSSIPYKLIKR